jgi:Ring hydroxylating beta subunit
MPNTRAINSGQRFQTEAFALTTTITREQVEDFLYAEADLLDSWRLDEWVGLFDQERGGYYMPTTDHPDGDPNVDLFLIADDMPKLRSRVEQLLSGLTWAENPRAPALGTWSATYAFSAATAMYSRSPQILSCSACAFRTSTHISAPIIIS